MMSKLKLGGLGPEGSFSHKQIKNIAKDGEEVLLFPTFGAVFNALSRGLVQKIIVPIENTTAFQEDEVISLLLEHKFIIREESYLFIRSNIVAKPATSLEDVKVIYSHKKALGQCKKVIAQHGWQKKETLSTSEAAKEVAGSKDLNIAAISSLEAAEIYNLILLKEDVGDRKKNKTRFLHLERPEIERVPILGKEMKATIFFITKNVPDALYRVLGCFAEKGINHCKLSSGPVPLYEGNEEEDTFGQYVFLMESEFRDDQLGEFRKSLSQMKQLTEEVFEAGIYKNACPSQENKQRFVGIYARLP